MKFDVKGFKDNIGLESKLRYDIREKLRNIFESFGYEPLETSMVERKEVLTFKGGNEIQEEIFMFQGRGGDNFGLRFDQTVPLARYFASNNGRISLPFRRFEIGPVFRDGPVQVSQGRYRSFTQCDVDIVGLKDMIAEAEILSIAQKVFFDLNLGEMDLKINNRKILNGILEQIGVNSDYFNRVISVLDKKDKIGMEGVREELFVLDESIAGSDFKKAILTYDQVKGVLNNISREGSNQETLKKISSLLTSAEGREGIQELSQVLDYCSGMGFEVQFDPSLARGLNYYTGTVFEVYLKDQSVISSAITAGGRYDNMLGDFLGKPTEIPAVGISFGLERLCQVITSTQDLPSSLVDLYVIPVQKHNQEDALSYANSLRRMGVKTLLGINEGKMSKLMKYANKKKIPYVAFVGDDEIKNERITLKNMYSGEQNTVNLSEVSLMVGKR